ncbi:MAG: cytochrome c peroxidase [Verrucomicrobiales bacterium]|jgi:cytochrome c peroxidase
MKSTLLTLSTFLALAAAVGAQEINKAQLAVFGTLPEAWENPENPITDAKVDLGRMLFYDARLSKSHAISCNSCHGLDTFGVDGKAGSVGHKGHITGRNSPTVYNAAAHLAQFWDGRAPDVEAQAKGPVLAGGEMAAPSEKWVVDSLKSIPGYAPLFKAAFPDAKDAITYDNMAKAIGVFERQLSTPGRFDEYLAGKDDALSEQETRGLSTFLATGCTTCHIGPAVGGLIYQKLGLVKPWPGLKDEGRSAVTGNEAEKGFFKVPSLRNIAETGPYLHDGSIDDLGKLVSMMAEHQLGKTLTDGEVKDVVAFLGALTGEVDEDYIKEPTLPESGPDTPKPDLN